MWTELESQPDGAVLVSGRRVTATEKTSAYGEAMRLLGRMASENGGPLLVRSTDGGAASWFTVSETGVVAMADAPAEPAAPPTGPTPIIASRPPRLETLPAAVTPRPRIVPETHVGPMPAAVPATRRRPSAADFGSHVPEPISSVAAEGWRGALNASGVFHLSPGADELQRRKSRASVQRGLPGHKTIVMVNLKGGATKTTVSYLTGATLGRVRGGTVLAWDNNENQGTLGDLALSAAHDLTATDLLDNIERFDVAANAPELMNYMRPQGENRFHVLASQNAASDQRVIEGSEFAQLHGILRQYYQLIIVDTGNAATASTWQAAVEIADEIVLVALNKDDSSKKLAATVDILIAEGYSDKLARGVLVLTEPAKPADARSQRGRKDVERRAMIREHFDHYVRDVVNVPYDEALSAGSQIVFENLSPATQRAYLSATAAIVDGL